jgi:hypothetical protein
MNNDTTSNTLKTRTVIPWLKERWVFSFSIPKRAADHARHPDMFFGHKSK